MTTTEVATQEQQAPATTGEVLEITPAMAEQAAAVAQRGAEYLTAVKTGEDSITACVELVGKMIAEKDYLFASDPTTGRPFTSHAAYLENLAAADTFPAMHLSVRTVLLDKLQAAGTLESMSKRELAAITGLSETAAANDKKAAQRRAQPPAPPEPELSDAEKQAAEQQGYSDAAARAVKQWLSLCDKLSELDTWVTEQEWSAIQSKGAELNSKVAAFLAVKHEGENMTPEQQQEKRDALAAERDAIADAEREQAAAAEPTPELVGAPQDPTLTVKPGGRRPTTRK